MEYRKTKNLETFLGLLTEEQKLNALGTLAREIQKIRAMPPGASRARWVHQVVDEAQARLAAQKPEIMKQVRCGRGCAHCCRVWVGITRDEAELLAERVRAGTAHPDAGRMELQRHWTSPMDFIGKPIEQTSCVFLDADGACTVYEDRPSICRAVLVASDPEFCKAGNEEAQTLNVLNPYLDVVASAALTVDAEGEPPPVYGRHLATELHAVLQP